MQSKLTYLNEFPIRICKVESDKYILFNTKNFKTIFVDNLGFQILNFIKENDYKTQSEVLEFARNLNIDNKINIDNEIPKFIEFLVSNSFLLCSNYVA